MPEILVPPPSNAFFPEAKGFGLADGWPEGGAPGGRVAEGVIDDRLASCLEKHNQ